MKFKTDTQVRKKEIQVHKWLKFYFQTLDTSQTKCVEEMQSKVYRLLGETPPNGAEFAKSVKI